MKTELRVLFHSPVAWLILIVFAFQVGLQFTDSLGDVVRSKNLGYGTNGLTGKIITFRGILGMMMSYLYLYIPLLTMSLMSRELGSGSIKLLYSSPVSNSQIIFGKYLSAIVYSLFLVAILLVPAIYTACVIESPDIPAMLVAVLGVFLTIAAYAAIGLFMSSITKYQVVAAVGTLVVLGALNFIGQVGQSIAFVRDVTFWLSIRGRTEIFINGMICTRDLLYFLLIISMFLALSILRLRGERLRLPAWRSAASYVTIVAAVVVLGYISSRPAAIAYYDATHEKRNTLSEASQKVLEKIDDPITITFYSNIMDDSWMDFSFETRNWEVKRFEQYLRFRPDIKFKEVYYWGEGSGFKMRVGDPGLSLEERFRYICKFDDQNPRKFIRADEITDDLSQEHGRFVRVLRAGDRVSYLRNSEDSYRYPGETEITTAFKVLVDPSPVVAFVTGHGERGMDDYGERGYGAFASNIKFRYALINQGFTIRETTLGAPVADDIDVLVVSDMRRALTEQEMSNFEDYVARGGNLLLMGEPRRQEEMNPLAALFGVRFENGMIVSPSEQYTDEVIAAEVMPTAAEVSEYFAPMVGRYAVTTPSVCAVEQFAHTGFHAIEVLGSPAGSWIEYQTTDFLEEKSTLDPATGESAGSRPVMLYLNRPVGDRDQRIFVCGDADCFATSELSSQRAGIEANNFRLVTEVFRTFSYGEYPVETPRMSSSDNKLNIGDTGLMWAKVLFIWVLPLLLLGASLWLWLSRRGR